MPDVSNTPVSSTLTGQPFGSTWASIFSIEFEPQVWQEWYQQFGQGFSVFDFLEIAGQKVYVKSDEILAYTDQAVERPAKTGSEISTGSAGASYNFYLDSTHYTQGSTTVDPHIRVGDTVFIDPQYTNKDVPTQWQVTAVGADDSSNTTIKPFQSDVQISTAVPSGSYLQVGPYRSGRRGGQPSARSTGTTRDTFYSTITKETGEIVGGINAKEAYRKTRDKSGKSVLFNKMQIETEFLMNAGMDKELFMGELNSNSITSTAKGSTTTATKGTKGLWHHVNDDGMELEYQTSFGLDYFDSVKDYLRSQGVTSTAVSFLTGSNLLRNIENNVLSYIEQYSGGTDLAKAMGVAGAQFKTFIKNGITFNLSEIVSFDNANSYGVMDDYFKNAGLIIPDAMATVKSDPFMTDSSAGKIKIPNVAIGYLANNNENRERMVGFESGVNGYGMPFMNEYDTVEYYIASEYMLVANLVNQMLKIHKADTY